MSINKKEIMPYIIGIVLSSIILGIGEDLNLSVLQIPSAALMLICFIVVLWKTDC